MLTEFGIDQQDCLESLHVVSQSSSPVRNPPQFAQLPIASPISLVNVQERGGYQSQHSHFSRIASPKSLALRVPPPRFGESRLIYTAHPSLQDPNPAAQAPKKKVARDTASLPECVRTAGITLSRPCTFCFGHGSRVGAWASDSCSSPSIPGTSILAYVWLSGSGGEGPLCSGRLEVWQCLIAGGKRFGSVLLEV